MWVALYIMKGVLKNETKAAIKYNKENGNLILENRSEKFGTLVLIRGNIKLNEEKINFQIGSSLISANITSNYENIENENLKINKDINI